jgi:glycosyltransferase involved in cell wall biosynthesis
LDLRVLFVTLDYSPGVAGGAEHQAQLQAEDLGRRGLAVTVVCPNFSGSGSGAINGVEVVRLRPGARLRQFAPFSGPRIFLHLMRHMRNFDVVHVHTTGAIGFLALLAGRLQGRRVYYKVTVALAGEKRSLIEKWLHLPPRRYRGLRMAARVQALTMQMREELIAARVDPATIALIPNCVDADGFRPVDLETKLAAKRRLGLDEATPLFLYAGRFARSKGIHVLLTAWKSLRHDVEAGLVLVGAVTGGRAAIPIPTEPGLVVRDWTSDIRSYYQASDFFVLPSFQEGMSNAVLEALSCGLAVIVTPAGAATGLVEDGVNGIVVPAGSPERLQEAMRRLTLDRPLAEKLSVAARESAQCYSVESVVTQIESVYGEMLAERQGLASRTRTSRPAAG